ncbi:hypothetical protein [Rhodococcus sp. NPDC055024]
MKARVAAVAAIAALALTLPACSSMNQQWHHNCVVEQKERLIRDGSSADKRVYTSCGSFVVNDSIAGGFSSQDRYNQLVEGRMYDLQTGDYRIGILSNFPNIIDVNEVTK